MRVTQKPYSLEVWQDKWIENSNFTTGGYWNEVKSVILSSDTLNYKGKAYDIKMNKNLNGEVTLSFSMDTLFYEEGQKVENYLIPYVFNETKIKLFYDNEWYDFIVKTVNENKNKTFTFKYECDFLPMAELAKTGYDISFSLDMENAIQKAGTFVSTVLEETDWQYVIAGHDGVVKDYTVDLTEYTEEQLYTYPITEGTSLIPISGQMDDNGEMIFTEGTPILAEDGIVYIPYSQLSKTGRIQVYYFGDKELLYDKNYLISNKGVLYYMNVAGAINIPLAASKYRGETIKTVQKNEYIYFIDENDHNNDITQYCNVYEYLNETYYSFTTSSNLDKGYTQTTDIEPDATKVYYYRTVSNNTLVSYRPYYGLSTWVSGTVYTDYYEVIPVEESTTVWDIENLVTETIVVFSITKNALNEITKVTRLTDGTLINNILANPVISIEKTRTLETSQSNRFNIIQEVSELFQIYARFIIKHDSTGKILLDEIKDDEDNLIGYQPQKYVTLVSDYGKENYAGFNYQINLKSIKRTIDSNSLSTKLWVEPSENDASIDGITSIQYADDNLAGELFLFDFSYFVQQGLLSETEVYNDLYHISSDIDEAGYLYALHELNKRYDNIMITLGTGQSGLSYQLASAKEFAEVFKMSYYTTGGSISNTIGIEDQTEEEKAIADKEADYATWQSYEELVTVLNNKIIAYQTQADDIIEQKKILAKKFFSKYNRFIQEGVWQDESYIDHNIYYNDALKVLTESTRPSIKYTLSIFDVSGIEGYELYTYDVGDITYIEDVDYFGYDDTGKPYHEKVIVSEIKYDITNPSKTTVTIQNYSTQFEDLFQRLSASTQNYELNKNIYARAQNIAASGGLEYLTLQDSFLKNKNLTLSDNNTVTIDNKGITLTNASNPDEIVRLVSGGMILSKDGGSTYDTGIYAGEINTSLLSAGQINAEKINITQGVYPSFTWNSDGLIAYKYTGSGEDLVLDSTSYIKLNENGIYGSKNDEKVFLLDWDGLYLKTGLGTYNLQLGEHIVDTTSYLISVTRNTDNLKTFYIDGDGNAYFNGEITATSGTIDNITATNLNIVSGTISETLTFGNTTLEGAIDDAAASGPGVPGYITSTVIGANSIDVHTLNTNDLNIILPNSSIITEQYAIKIKGGFSTILEVGYYGSSSDYPRVYLGSPADAEWTVGQSLNGQTNVIVAKGRWEFENATVTGITARFG